jgi:hypothetical protein
MAKTDAILGPALGSSLVLDPLLATLVSRGILSAEDAGVVIDSALSTLDDLEAVDESQHFEMWEEARRYISSLRTAVEPPR